ncbi:hypothetical protein Gotri_027962 [Gossypium trilobum]|uniref:Uncharacterized protein n=1 Tax=Gossypium trilobum TaxID=34281 RepID=A0A7J9FTN1_9ROSI|nr:hypothetical protein [Gossypium trilobum]
MTTSLIRFNDKHLFVDQAVMVSNKFDGGRISMNWLAKKFYKLLMDATETELRGITKELKDIRLLSDQRLEADFEWMPYVDNDMHPTGSVGQSGDVGCKCVVESVCDGGNARIKPGDATVWVETTNFAATVRLEGAVQVDTVVCLEYLSWFRVTGKSYMLLVEARSRQLHQKRQQRPPEQQYWAKCSCMVGSSLDPPQEAPHMSTQYPDYFTQLVPVHFTNPIFLQALHNIPPPTKLIRSAKFDVMYLYCKLPSYDCVHCSKGVLCGRRGNSKLPLINKSMLVIWGGGSYALYRRSGSEALSNLSLSDPQGRHRRGRKRTLKRGENVLVEQK